MIIASKNSIALVTFSILIQITTLVFANDYEYLPGDYYDKYIDCGINEHTLRGRSLTTAELDQLCEEFKKERQNRYIKNGLIFIGVMVVSIIIFRGVKKSLKPGIEFQKMAEAINGVYGIIQDLELNKKEYNDAELKENILYCAYISQKEILSRIRIYKWGELTPMRIPLISDKTINLQLALKKSVESVKKWAVDMNLKSEVDEIFSQGDLYDQYEKTKIKPV